MIEAFERNLRLQKIKLRLEEAETEEDLLRICEEYVKSKKPKQDINSFFYEETKNQYSGDPSSQIMKQYIQHPFPGQTTDTIFINES